MGLTKRPLPKPRGTAASQASGLTAITVAAGVGRRGFVTGRVRSQGGAMVASCAQEGMLRWA